MRIKTLRVRNFRSIDDMTVQFGALNAFCGHNSCGKSNILRAIQFAFKDFSANIEENRAAIYKNMISAERDTAGGPNLSIYIDITFENCPTEITNLAGNPLLYVNYSFRAKRNGTVIRKLNNKTIDSLSIVKKHYDLIYVPPIRDLSADGIEPFKKIFADALKRARGATSLKHASDEAKRILKGKADSLLASQLELAKGILHASGLEVNTDEINLDSLYEAVKLVVNVSGTKIPLEELGTGHQSAVIMHLFRQLGELAPGQTLYLFEEPDNHLHPATIRAIGDDLIKLSEKDQVVITTHSPILLTYLGFKNTTSLYTDSKRITNANALSHVTKSSDFML